MLGRQRHHRTISIVYTPIDRSCRPISARVKAPSSPVLCLYTSIFIITDSATKYLLHIQICNGNRTEWSPIRSVIIRVINKIGRPRSGSPICLITSMITDRIGRHEVLLPINHNINKICDIIGYFLNQNTRKSKFCFASSEKKKAI